MNVEDDAKVASKLALTEGGYLDVTEERFPNSQVGFLSARTPDGLEVQVRYEGQETPWCIINDNSSEPSLVLIGPGIPTASQARQLVSQRAGALPQSVDSVRAEGWTIERIVFGGEWSMEIKSYAEIEGYKIEYILHPEEDEWVHFAMGLGLVYGVDWYTPPNTIVSRQTAFNALYEARESGAPTQSPLEGLREGTLQALREAGEEIGSAGWSVAVVDDSTLTLVGVSGVPMGREMLELELRVQNWGEKDLVCTIRGYFPDASVASQGTRPEPREFVGGAEGITARKSEGGIPSPQQAAQLLLRHEEYDVEGS